MGARSSAESNQAQCKRANRPGRSVGAANHPAKHPLRRVPRANADLRGDAAAHRARGPEQVEQGATAPCRSSNKGCAMKQKWGRPDDAGDFPSDKAVWTIGAFCVALLSGMISGATVFPRTSQSQISRNRLGGAAGGCCL